VVSVAEVVISFSITLQLQW